MKLIFFSCLMECQGSLSLRIEEQNCPKSRCLKQIYKCLFNIFLFCIFFLVVNRWFLIAYWEIPIASFSKVVHHSVPIQYCTLQSRVFLIDFTCWLVSCIWLTFTFVFTSLLPNEIESRWICFNYIYKWQFIHWFHIYLSAVLKALQTHVIAVSDGTWLYHSSQQNYW